MGTTLIRLYPPIYLPARNVIFGNEFVRQIKITIQTVDFTARFENELSPQTCDFFRSILPLREKLIHVRWSGEACWIPLGNIQSNVPTESPTSYPAPGQVIFYPGGISEAEILIAYGSVCFASRAGQLAGNHFLTITDGLESLANLGRKTLWEGAQDIVFHNP
jgi:hypothetical protein